MLTDCVARVQPRQRREAEVGHKGLPDSAPAGLMWGSSAAPGKTKGPSGAEGRALESLQCRKRGAGADFEEADGEEFLCCLAKCGCFRRGAEKEGARCRASLPPPAQSL